ncbi:unnamed protein product [Chilo suppressalis]|uniref:Gem-associated protein 2 n=1 Tax=Chilo suppressalis TaxID=168631 RepID=A0ABN8BCL0_CHISP|nr:unnamed protein product [Chilo suppressalis]
MSIKTKMSEDRCLYKCTDDKEEDFLNSPCFKIGSGVQLKDVPTTGEEYLLKVMKERQNYSTITKCNKDYSKYLKNQSCFVVELPHAKAPERLIPTIEWQNIQVADFSDVRMYISRLLANKSLWPNNIEKVKIEENTVRGWKTFFLQREPTLTCVLGLPHILLDRGLEVLTEILAQVSHGDSIDHRTGQWIYAFLACTRQPLLSDTISILRNLARKCAEIRSHIKPDGENATFLAAPLNIFICIIARYFRQYDLAD